jgi:hypothetical protein
LRCGGGGPFGEPRAGGCILQELLRLFHDRTSLRRS